ncbi:hypothetical protein K525DRAFT_282352 [Schizophyllum commune Loenen D]|nr:hypothetical protein K525DRAFT_282352 [Schizophyllum commune Loenen D]
MESLDHLLRTNRRLSEIEERSARQLLLDTQQRLDAVSRSTVANRCEEYGRLLARIDALTYILAPIRTLPLELLSIVFNFYLCMVHYGRVSVKGRIELFMKRIHEGPCLLLHICSLWRNVCRSTASIQSFFASMVLSIPSGYLIGDPEALDRSKQPVVHACLAHYIAQFDRGPLTIVMWRGHDLPLVLDPEYGAEYAQRCSNLAVYSQDNGDDGYASIQCLLLYLSSRLSFMHGHLDRLETLCLGFTYTGEGYEGRISASFHEIWIANKVQQTRLFAYAPKLCRLRLLQHGLRLLTLANPRFTLPWNQIQELYAHYDDPAICLAGLFSLPSVREVSLLRFGQARTLHRRSRHLPWPGYYITEPFRLPCLLSLTLFYHPRQHSDERIDGRDWEYYTTAYPAEVLDMLEAPSLEQLRVGFADCRTSFATVSTISAFLLRSGCGLVKLYLSLQMQDVDDDIAGLLRSVASLQELTLCMHAGVTLSLGVLASLVVTPGGWNNLLPALRRFTLITDDSPDTMDFKSDPLADVIESRVNAHQRTEGSVASLEIFQLACQEDHPFAVCPKIKKRMGRWMRDGLKVATAVVDLPTQFVSIRDEGEFLVDWEWLRPE